MDPRAKRRVTRYLERQHRQASAHVAKLDPNGWFDLWHTHLDWKSKAGRDKVQVAGRIVRLLAQVQDVMRIRADEVQIWATLCEDTGDSAVYVHSANPNGTPYPYQFENVQWGAMMPSELKSVLTQDHQLGIARYGTEIVYIVRGAAQRSVAADRAKTRAG